MDRRVLLKGLGAVAALGLVGFDTTASLPSWEERGWIVSIPDLPENFRELTWGELGELGLSSRRLWRQHVRVFDQDDRQIGCCVAIDTNTQTAWKVQLLLADGSEEDQRLPSSVQHDEIVAYIQEWTRSRPLRPIKYSRMEWLT